MLNKFWFYTIIPLYIQVVLLLLFFHIPSKMMFGVFFLPVLFTIFSIVLLLFFSKKIAIEKIVNDNSWTLKNQCILVFCWFIVFLVPLDVLFNGFKLADPGSYAEFSGIGKNIRHLTNFSWFITLFSAIFYRRSWQFKFLLLVSLIMPVIFVDRNRLLMCFFNLFLVWYFSTGKLDKVKKIKLISFLVITLGLFASLGSMRSGNSFYVQSSGEHLEYGSYPLKEYFYFFSSGIQQIILYITTPLFNFAHMLDLNFQSDVFLLKQISFINREAFPQYPYSPVLVTRYNVGTEFFPILLALGTFGVTLSIVVLLLYFFFFYILIYYRPNIFSLAFFCKIAYLILLVGFAPQFYIFYNFFSTIVLVILIGFVYLFDFIFRPYVKF